MVISLFHGISARYMVSCFFLTFSSGLGKACHNLIWNEYVYWINNVSISVIYDMTFYFLVRLLFPYFSCILFIIIPALRITVSLQTE
ncbi:uncharacterized protein BYT42DRAFT_556896 [Radiomyces spectabilis]|uniref:uncharacterized protein n=1 Tax=Radiomyces spectabilis TaxID=64574 RepID=UPI002220558B|nr:uncharacterized protein BYT42DRAFT_556896 [Radiomyces spectabilis]KAI8391455.1 hypothetical protein BYT42DRAFT_556896 [Radiomyces spectabilis]